MFIAPSIGKIFVKFFLFRDFSSCVNNVLFKVDVILNCGSLSTGTLIMDMLYKEEWKRIFGRRGVCLFSSSAILHFKTPVFFNFFNRFLQIRKRRRTSAFLRILECPEGLQDYWRCHLSSNNASPAAHVPSRSWTSRTHNAHCGTAVCCTPAEVRGLLRK